MYQSVIFLVLVTRAIKKSVCIASGEVDIILSLLFAKKPIKSEPPDVIWERSSVLYRDKSVVMNSNRDSVKLIIGFKKIEYSEC